MNPYLIANFYRFVDLPEYSEMKEPLLKSMTDYGIKGTIILAHEGINSSISGVETDVSDFLSFLTNFHPFKNLRIQKTYGPINPFSKAKVKLRKEIVTLGVEGVNPIKSSGKHLSPHEWNNLLRDPDVVVIDTRNDYEIKLGTFKGAINPKTENFRDFPRYVQQFLLKKKNKKIAMHCTGGIRCEKSTAYLQQLGFKDVYQLEGGILAYLEAIPQEDSLWEGSCFVFDDRVAVDKELCSLKQGSIDKEWKNKHRKMSSEG